MRGLILFFPKAVKFVIDNAHYIKPIIEGIVETVQKVKDVHASNQPKPETVE